MPDLLDDLRRPGTVHIWYADPGKCPEPCLQTCRQHWLPPDELARHQRIPVPAVQREYLVTRGLLRSVLSRYADVERDLWQFRVHAHGKPSLAGPRLAPDLQFNLSHTQGLVLLALAWQTPIGVDAEAVDRRVDLRLAEGYFSYDEVQQLRRLPVADQPRRFLEFWTLKEAYLKATGEGLRTPLDAFGFSWSATNSPLIRFREDWDDDPRKWRFFQLSCLSSSHLAALAIRQPEDHQLSVRAWELKDLSSPVEPQLA